MRAVALCVLVLVASASAAWNTFLVPGDSLEGVQVSQTGLVPGRTSISSTELAAGQLDVRTGQANTALTTTYSSGVEFTAPYAGCYYFYTAAGAPVSTTPLCTKWAEWETSTSRTPAAVTLTLVGGRIFSNAGQASPTTPYTFTLSFKVDAGYAGTAFEFLNQNVANPTDSDTRCGVAYNNLIAATGTIPSIPSPHASGNLNFVITNPGTDASTNGAWSFADLFTGVDATNANGVVNYTVSNYNTVLANCGWKRDETSADFVIYRAQIRITTVQQGRSIRGVLYKSIKESVVEIGIRFSTQVVAFSSTLNVNNILINYAQLVKQVFDPVQRKAFLLLFTSSQGPYQLEPSTLVGSSATGSAECISASGQGCKSAGWGSSPVAAFHYLGQDEDDVVDLKLASDLSERAVGSANGRAECWSQTNDVPDYGSESPQLFSQCNQYWFMQLGAPSECNGFDGTQTLDGSWRVNFKISCHSSYTGSCVIQAPTANTITVDFGTQSDNYCPRIVDTITASAVLKVFDDEARTNEQSQFVFGTTSYFVATVQSTIQTAALFTEEVAITKGGAVDNQNFAGTPTSTAWVSASTTTARQLVFSSTFNTALTGNAAAYFASVESTSCVGGSGFNTVLSDEPEVQTGATIDVGAGYFTRRCYFAGLTGTGTGTTPLPIRDFAITQFNATSGNTGLLTSANYFQWYWDSAVSKAQGDFAEITEVKWIGRLRYTDQAAAPKLSTIIRANHLDAVGTTSASVTSTMSAPQAAAPSEAAISTTTIAVAAAAVAAVAVMAIAAFVVLRSRNVKAEAETNLESVTLGSVHSASSAQL